MSTKRQLAAIMFTDIQGYTALMQQNEKKALQVRDKHRHIFNSATKNHQGKVLQYYGDGTLSVFDSAIDAVECGIEMQLGFLKDPSIPVRIGIHTGDIVFSEEEIIGDSVNIAARIEAQAVPGSVFISDKVYDEIKNQATIKTVRLNTIKLKNVERPVEIYAVSNAGLIVPEVQQMVSGIEIDAPIVPRNQEERESISQKKSSPPIILATKLYVPVPRTKMLHRPRLIDKINRGLHGKLTLISAPAGFGKTTLVSEWISGCDRPVAWLSLDEGDNDPVRFLSYFIAALQKIGPTIGTAATALLRSPQPPPNETVVTSLLNDISMVREHFILVLDDYHVIETKAIEEVIALLLDHQPPQIHLVFTTRKDPNLPLPRLRVRGQMTEFRIKDLRFTPSEAAAFLRQVMDLDLSEEDINALERRTEGWVAGLQLAALSMQGREDISGFVKAFAGHDRHIVDYLAEEVLQRQSDRIRRFLLQTSILDRFSGPLCDAITDQEDGKSMLEILERGNLFIIPLDDKREWYRYHHLFADVLHARAMEEQPTSLPALHRRASVWFEKNGLLADAVGHALAAEDFVRAAGLIELAWPDMERSFQSATWLGWAKKLPAELIRPRPVLSVACAWALFTFGDLEAGEARLRDAEQWLDAGAKTSGRENPDLLSPGMVVVDEEQFQSLPASIATARAYHCGALGDVDGIVKYAHLALDLLQEGDYFRRATPSALLGLAYLGRGDLETSLQSFADFIENMRKGNDIATAIGTTYILADIMITQGRLRQAISTYQKAIQLAKDQGDHVLRGAADLYLGLSELYREQGDMEASRGYLLKTEELSEYATLADWPYCWCLAKARIKEAQGDLHGALNLLEEAEQLYLRTPMPEVRPVAALKTRVWLGLGMLSEALAWAEEKGLTPDDELSYVHEFEHITLARLLIARYSRDRKESFMYESLDLLERLLKAAEAGGRMGSVIEILVLKALAHKALGNMSFAIVTLERALALAEPENYVRIFLDEGMPMAQLLSEAAAQGIMKDYTGKLLEVFEAGQQQE